jgi:type IV secretion system protein VirB4
MTIIETIFQAIAKRNKAAAKVVATKPDEDFIPYASHLDKNTVLTKNGELIQIIRITGKNENTGFNLFSLRDSIRDAIAENVKDEYFAFWFHTIRRKKSVASSKNVNYDNFFANEIDEIWIKQNGLHSQFVNELYITIIHEGLENSIADISNLSKSFSYKATRNAHQEHLKESHKKLCEFSQKIYSEVIEHGAKILEIKDYEGVIYSEPMRFFGKIANLFDEHYPLTFNDISSDIVSHKLAFGTREIQVVGEKNNNFAAIFSIKEYHEVSTESLEKILNLPFEFIITQSFDFVYDKKDLEPYENSKHLLEVSKDQDFYEIAGYNSFFHPEKTKKTDYGKMQTSLMVINESLEELEKDSIIAVEKFSELGFILIREDVFLEHCFWAQLPANFAFLRRKKIINTDRIAGFASLESFPSGSSDKNHWGDSVATFKTIINSHYFFNFHEQDLGHTLIFGDADSGKTTLTNFLLAKSLKYNCRIFYLDTNQSSRCFINAIGGSYYKTTDDENDEEILKLNPLSLSQDDENAGFIAHLFLEMAKSSGAEISDDESYRVFEIVKNVMGQNSANFLVAYEALQTKETSNVFEKLKVWAQGKLSYIFGATSDIDWSQQHIGLNLDSIKKQKPILFPVIAFLLQKILDNLDGKPSIIVIDDAFRNLNDEFFTDYFDSFLKQLRQKNCMVIFQAKNNEHAKSEIAKIIRKNLATELYLPCDEVDEVFELQEDEAEVLQYIKENGSRNVLLKHAGDSLILNIDFSFYEELLLILSADEIVIASFEELMNSYKQENQEPKVEEWLPELIELIKELS